MKKMLLLVALVIFGLQILHSQEVVNDSVNTVIRKHGMDESQVMDIASWMTDVYGPRLTGSPMLDKATEWAVKQLKDWGYQNVHLDEWGPFGRGWEMQPFEMHCFATKTLNCFTFDKLDCC